MTSKSPDPLVSSTSSVRYPSIVVQLSGEDGNAFSILAKVSQALRRAKVSAEEQALFRKEAMSGDYNHLLAVCMSWVDAR
jgi:hypothetical protein